MPKEFGRNRRVGDLIQRELAPLMQRELDPSALGLVTLSGVDVSPDLKHARVFFTCFGGPLGGDKVAVELNAQASHFRHHLARNLSMRTVPRLQFVFDESVARGSRLSALLDSLSRDGDDK